MVNRSAPDRWILAFDSACASCSRLSLRIAQACDGNLETLPLTSEEVERLRREALGSLAPWEPTLIQVRLDSVQAWTGRSMILPLLKHLGIRSSIAVTRTLGTLRNELETEDSEQQGATHLTRKRFLQLGAGAAIAGSLALTGQVPAYASSPARTWVGANKNNLPATYSEFSRYPSDYRREIYRELTPARRSRLWIEQIQQYKDAHPNLTVDQLDILEEATATVSDQATTATIDRSKSTASDEAFSRRSKAAFGDDAGTLFANLGPAPQVQTSTSALALCGCSIVSPANACFIGCGPAPCGANNLGCGLFYQYRCDGDCDPFR